MFTSLPTVAKGALYTGVTTSLGRRHFEHQQGSPAGFTSRYGITKLVYAEQHEQVEDAIVREKCIKKWRRQWKVNLIEKANPEWKELSSDVPLCSGECR
jgi:putative endonuclease